MSSSGIGMVGMLGRLMLTLPSELASLDPDLPINLDQSWGLGTSSRARKSYTVFIPDFLFRMGFRRNVSLSHLIEADNLSQGAQCPLPEKGNLPWILSVSPSHHRIPSPHPRAAPTESCISIISKRQQNSFSSWDKTWSPNNNYWFETWICKVKQVSNYQSHL